MMVQAGQGCFVCGKPFGAEGISHAIAGAPPGCEALVDTPCFDRIVQIEAEESCTQLEALLTLSARFQGALLKRAAQKEEKEAYHA